MQNNLLLFSFIYTIRTAQRFRKLRNGVKDNDGTKRKSVKQEKRSWPH